MLTDVTSASHQGVALKSHAASEGGQLQFEQGEIILVFADTQQVCFEILVNYFIFPFTT